MSGAGSSISRVRAVIVESQDSGLRLMRSSLTSIPDIEVIAEVRNALDARARISVLQPDLVLMDVVIRGGDGIELLRGLDPQPRVIIVTAHPEFAVSAFELRAIDYLVKPVSHQRLVESILRAKRRIAERRIAQLAMQISGAATAIDGGHRGTTASLLPTYPSQLTVRVRRRVFWLDITDILWIQGASQYSRVHARTGEFLIARSLSSLECELDPSRFFRIHRSAIVNANHVQEIRSSGEGRYNIHLRSGLSLPMGRSRRELLGKLLEGVAGRHH
jgi:two-component system, LytTR family, response regulator